MKIQLNCLFKSSWILDQFHSQCNISTSNVLSFTRYYKLQIVSKHFKLNTTRDQANY